MPPPYLELEENVKLTPQNRKGFQQLQLVRFVKGKKLKGQNIKHLYNNQCQTTQNVVHGASARFTNTSPYQLA